MLLMSDHGDDDIGAEETAEESESEPEIEARSVAGKMDFDGHIATNGKKFKRTWDNYEIESGLS